MESDSLPVRTHDDERSLDGFVVGITADRRWSEQAELLERRGATVVHGPTIHTRTLRSAGVRAATERVLAEPPDVVVANTGIGMRAWLDAADSWGIADDLLEVLRRARIYARGPKASAALHQHGLQVTATTPSERLVELIDLLATHEQLAGATVVFQRHGVEAPLVVSALQALGARVHDVLVYDWTLPEDPRPALRLAEAIASRRVHGVTFTSSPAVRNLIALADSEGFAEDLLGALNGSVVAACVGPVCASAATAAGVTSVLLPDHHRLGALVRRLADALVDTERSLRIDEEDVVLRGTVLLRRSGRLVLADREAAVLAALARRPGRVVTKAALLEEVWGSAAGDPHVVEVTVGRLRRRLADLGTSVVVVPRRGYLLDAHAIGL